MIEFIHYFFFSMHPNLPILATASGQWKSAELISDEEENNFFKYSNKNKGSNCLKLWNIG